MILEDRPGATAERRVASRLVYGLEERLGLPPDRDPDEDELLVAAFRLAIEVTRRKRPWPGLPFPLHGVGVASGIRPPAYAAPAPRSDTTRSVFPLSEPPDPSAYEPRFQALGQALQAELRGSEVVLGLVKEHLSGIPDSANRLLAGRAPSVSLASFQHLVAAIAGALAARGAAHDPTAADPGLALVFARLHGVLGHLYRLGELPPPEVRFHLVGRARHLHYLLRAVAGHLVRRLDLSAIQILAIDAEAFLVLAPSGEALPGVLESVESHVNRWFLSEFEGRIHLALDATALGRKGMADLGHVFVSAEARQDHRRRQPFRSNLPDLFGPEFPSLAAGRCPGCGFPRPSTGSECPRCRAWLSLGREQGAAPSGIAIEVEDIDAEAESPDPLLEFAPLATFHRLGAEGVPPPAAPAAPFEADALLWIHVKDLVPLFAFGDAQARSIGAFLDLDGLVRTFLGVHLPGRIEELGLEDRIAWSATARRFGVVGPWRALSDIAVDAISEFQRMSAATSLALAGALVEFGSFAELDLARERAESALRRAALRGGSTIEVLGRTLAWSGQDPDSFASLHEMGRSMARAVDHGLAPGFLAWLASLSRRYGIGQPQADPLWQPALLGGVVRRLRDRRHAELRRTLLAETRERERLLAQIEIPVRYALGGIGT